MPPQLRSIAVGTLAVLAAIDCLAAALLYVLQSRLVFVPDKLPKSTVFHFDAPFEERFIGDLDSLLFPAKDARGTAELQSAGTALYDAALAGEHGDERRIVVYGRSLGSAIAINLAAQRNPAALVLETPFDSLRSLAKRLFPWAPTFLIRYPLRSDLDAPKIRCPTLVLHGTADEVVPYAQGATLARRIPQASLITIRGGHHNDLSSSRTYWTALTRFLALAR